MDFYISFDLKAACTRSVIMMMIQIHTKDCHNDEPVSSDNYSTANWDVWLRFSRVLPVDLEVC